MFTLNALLSEYRKSWLEAENASAGKRLLAEQARGVSTILKNLALEQSSPLSMNPDAERRIRDLVAQKGRGAQRDHGVRRGRSDAFLDGERAARSEKTRFRRRTGFGKAHDALEKTAARRKQILLRFKA